MQVFEDLSDLTPKQVVERLDRNIVGQTDAKKAVCAWSIHWWSQAHPLHLCQRQLLCSTAAMLLTAAATRNGAAGS